MKKRVIALFLAILMCTMFVLPASAATNELPANIETIVYEYIDMISEDSSYLSSWDHTTTISNVFVCYDPNDEINAYMIELMAGNVSQGYIEVSLLLGEPTITGFGFEGKSYLREMFDSCNIELDATEKIYFYGGYDYAAYSNDNLVMLSSNTIIEDVDSLNDQYTENIALKKEMMANTPELAITTAYVLDTSKVSFVTTGTFSSYSNHCTPTAGVNIAKYWAQQRGFSGVYESDALTFARLYYEMETNVHGNGTSYSLTKNYGYEGLLQALPISVDDGRGLSPSMATLSVKLTAGVPLMLTCVNYEGGGDHTICLFGHTANTLHVINGWSTSITYKTYSSLTIFDYYYIAYE